MSISAGKQPGSLGVVIGRFQTPHIHEGHRDLLEMAGAGGKLLVLLGISNRVLTPTDPLDFHTRALMLRGMFPDAVVLPLPDQPTDKGWSEQIDQLIRTTFPLDTPTLYFGRNSAIASYHGVYKTHLLADEVHHVSSSELRSSAASRPLNMESFRAGVIYAAHNTWPTTIPVVDIGIWRTREGITEVLLGRRTNEGGRYRFPGGHVDVEDSFLEQAVLREAHEEVPGLELAYPEYVASLRVKQGPGWSMMTSLYAVQAMFGNANAASDLDHVEWRPAGNLMAHSFTDNHEILASSLINYLTKMGKI